MRIPWDPRSRPSVRRSSQCCSAFSQGPQLRLLGSINHSEGGPSLWRRGASSDPPSFIPLPSIQPSVFWVSQGRLRLVLQWLFGVFFPLLFNHFGGLKAAFRGAALRPHPQPSERRRFIESQPGMGEQSKSCLNTSPSSQTSPILLFLQHSDTRRPQELLPFQWMQQPWEGGGIGLHFLPKITASQGRGGGGLAGRVLQGWAAMLFWLWVRSRKC